MRKTLIIFSVIITLTLISSCYKSASSEIYFDGGDRINKPISIMAADDDVYFNFDNTNVTFFMTTREEIKITYQSNELSNRPDYITLTPHVETKKTGKYISFDDMDLPDNIYIYIPRSIKNLYIYHDTGNIVFNDDIYSNLSIVGNNNNIKVNYIKALLNIDVNKGNITVLNGVLPKESKILTKSGNINICSQFEPGDFMFETDYGNISLQSKTQSITLKTVGYTRKNEFSQNTVGTAIVTLNSQVGVITATKF